MAVLVIALKSNQYNRNSQLDNRSLIISFAVILSGYLKTLNNKQLPKTPTHSFFVSLIVSQRKVDASACSI